MNDGRTSSESNGAEMRSVRLRYGVNESDSWWHFALGPGRERIWRLHREMRTEIIRIFLFDKNAPDPLGEWDLFRSYVNAVLAVGATPLITYAKYHRPLDDPRAVRWFAEQCGEIVWHCLEEWGEEQVRDWHWCVWNEPNNTWIGGDVTFEQYRDIYESVAHAILRWLKPCLGLRPAPIGGPAVEGFQPFWKDWIWRFIVEIDADLVGFVNWHRYADWRNHGEKGAPVDAVRHESVMLWQAREYEVRARSIGRLLRNREVLNMCGEWNAHSHYLPRIRARFNQTLFGAAYGALALLHLIRGGVDAEMLWTGTDDACGYGVIGPDAKPTPLYFARCLCAQYIQYGDTVVLPALDGAAAGLDGMVVHGRNGRSSTLLVHREPTAATYDLDEVTDGQVGDGGTLIKIDCDTGNTVATQPCDGSVTFAGYGVGVVTNEVAGSDLRSGA